MVNNAIFFVCSIAIVYFLPCICRYYSQWRMMYQCKKKGYIVLSFDDGPGQKLTPALLDVLEQKNTKATFFVLGNKIEGHEVLLRRMIAGGHEIGCHGYAHSNAWKANPFDAIRNISKGRLKLSQLGFECKLFRPPYGKINIFTWAYIVSKKMKSCWWTDVSGDTFSPLPCPHDFVSKILKKRGGVILMHDLDRSEQRMNYVMQVTFLLIEGANKHGLQIKTISEICD